MNIEGLRDPGVEVGVPGGPELLALVDAFVGGEAAGRAEARSRAVEALGPAGFVDAAAVFGNFEMMNRVAEGTGIPVAPQAIAREAETMKALGLYDTLKSQHL